MSIHSYNTLKKVVLEHGKLPAMFVDLDIFESNIDELAKICRAHKKDWRPATKSMRVLALNKRIKERVGPLLKGLMCFSIFEADYLFKNGFNDLLVAYPISTKAELEMAFSLLQKGCNFHLMIDSHKHVEQLAFFLKTKIMDLKNENDEKYLHFQVCIDVDMSWRPFNLLHLGVRRSPVRNLDNFKNIFSEALKTDLLLVTGVMGYEAQVAGLPDKNVYNSWQNPVKHMIRHFSKKHVLKLRGEIRKYLDEQKYPLKFMNGGGTGCFEFAAGDQALTEITSGSGHLQSQIFDYYQEKTAQELLRPAFFFALPVCRFSDKNILTVKSGGFIASGEIGKDKAPTVYLPKQMKLIDAEGLGEVQTPLEFTGDIDFKLGDPIFFRPAKAGEIAEHFDSYVLFRKDKIEEVVKTYRGDGLNFF